MKDTIEEARKAGLIKQDAEELNAVSYGKIFLRLYPIYNPYNGKTDGLENFYKKSGLELTNIGSGVKRFAAKKHISYQTIALFHGLQFMAVKSFTHVGSFYFRVPFLSFALVR